MAESLGIKLGGRRRRLAGGNGALDEDTSLKAPGSYSNRTSMVIWQGEVGGGDDAADRTSFTKNQGKKLQKTMRNQKKEREGKKLVRIWRKRRERKRECV